MTRRRAVVAIGGNSLIKDRQHQTVRDQYVAAGSMAPQVEAVIGFLEQGGARAIVTDPENVERALAGEAGTTFVPG